MLIRFVAHALFNMIAILIIAHFVPRLMWVDSLGSAISAAFLLGIVNALLRPILIVLTIPLTILTLGLFLIVINGLMLWLVAALVAGFHVNGFWGALWGSILISLISWLFSHLLLR